MQGLQKATWNPGLNLVYTDVRWNRFHPSELPLNPPPCTLGAWRGGMLVLTPSGTRLSRRAPPTALRLLIQPPHLCSWLLSLFSCCSPFGLGMDRPGYGILFQAIITDPCKAHLLLYFCVLFSVFYFCVLHNPHTYFPSPCSIASILMCFMYHCIRRCLGKIWECDFHLNK